MFFIKKGKIFLNKLKKTFKEKKQKQDELKKESVNIRKLPEKVEHNIKLNEIITF